MLRRTNLRSQKGASEITQFPLTIYILFIAVFLPVINLVSLLIAGTTAYLATNDFAAKAATQPSYQAALNAMAVEAYTFQSNNLARFAKMVPEGGYTGCGNDLFVLATNIGGSGVQTSSADQPLGQKIDTSKSIYELQVVSKYSVSPLVSFANIPLLASIPGLGQPVVLSFAASRPVEHPGGLQTATSPGGTGNVTPFNRILATAPVTTQAAADATWRTPEIFKSIQDAGQTVLSVNVIMVDPTNPNWTPTGVNITPGEKIWVDTQAVGQWNTPGLASVDANGIPGTVGSNGDQCATANFAALVGVVGVTGPITANTPNSFLVGNFQYNYPLTSTGPLSMSFNDWNFGPGAEGSQMVRIIVTQ